MLTDGHEEANSRCSQFCEQRLKTRDATVASKLTLRLLNIQFACNLNALKAL